jgi:vacuolar-type H+-ATPase subunit B/Vma2
MNNALEKQDYHGESREDFLHDTEYDRRREELRGLGWEIIDMLPEEKRNNLKAELIDEIISEGWDNE